MPSVLSAPHFHNEEAAFEYVETQLWPNGPVCPFCGATGEKIGRLNGKTTRPGLRKCYACRKPFTVRIGTIFESSHAPLRYWLQAIYLLCSSKKGVSTRQLQRTLGCGMKTAWFLGHRIRHAMAPADGSSEPLGGLGKIVEADETELSRSHKSRRRPRGQNPKVVSLVERGGRIRSFPLKGKPMEVRGVLMDHLHPDSTLHTDKARHYVGSPVAKHESVDHSKMYVTPEGVHTNTLEGFFSVFKRGMVGTYQHCGEQHHLAEFDYRRNTREKLGINDEARTAIAVKSGKGKRLTYRTTNC